MDCKIMTVEKYYGLPFMPYIYPDCFFSFIDCVDLYFTHIDLTVHGHKDLLIKKAGLFSYPFVNNTDNPWSDSGCDDITCCMKQYPEPINEVCEATGYAYEIIQKFGGVYGKFFYKYRIIENILLGKPVIARSNSDTGNWLLIVGYNPESEGAIIRTSGLVGEIGSWYESIEELVLFGDKPHPRKAHNLGRA